MIDIGLLKEYTTSDVYTLKANSFRFNDEYVEFNPLHTEEEYISTKISIQEKGQLKPVFMLNGECVDGRHRNKICSELGLEVYAVDLNPDLSKDTIYDLCNIDTMSGRTLTATQRAIAALLYKERLGIQQQEVAKKFQVTRQSIMYADKLKNKYGQEEAVQELHKGNAVQLANMDSPSKSIEYVCKKAKELYEQALIVVEEKERIQFNPESQIKTEQGKELYYRLVNTGIPNSNVELRKALVEYVNLKYRID